MHAYIIIGSSKEDRQTYIAKQAKILGVSAWDTAILAPSEDAPYGVDAVHAFLSHLSLSAVHAKQKIGIIQSVDMLTIEGQNALLKTIEEPPPNTQIFMETNNPAAVLPTILSRSQTIAIIGIGSGKELDKNILEQLLSATPGNQIALTSDYTDTSDHAASFLDEAIHAAGSRLLESHEPAYARLLHELFSAKSELAVHVNPKLVIDHIFFQYYLDKVRGIV